MPLLRLTVIAVAVVLCSATSAPRYRYPRSFPTWRAEGPASRVTACAEVKAWISKSGKQGIGATVRLTGRGERACRAEVASARFAVGQTGVAAAALPTSVVVQPDAVQYFYLPFAFDNEAAWNRGDRRGELVVALVFDGVPGPELRVAFEHRRDRAHDRVDYHQPRLLPPAPQPAPQPVAPRSL